MSVEPNRLFFALWPDDAVRAAAAAAARRLRVRLPPGGRPSPPERYHITLQFLGSTVPAHEQAAVVEAAARVRAVPFVLRLDQAGSFRARSIPWWLGCREVPAELGRLHEQLRDSLRRIQVSGDRTRFIPHLTIQRDARQSLPPTPIAPIDWHVEDFVLVRSRLDLNPVAYEVIGRWPLRTEPDAGQLALPL